MTFVLRSRYHYTWETKKSVNNRELYGYRNLYDSSNNVSAMSTRVEKNNYFLLKRKYQISKTQVLVEFENLSNNSK